MSETTTKTTDVLIVGGGGAGLTASMLLSRLGVDHLLVSSLPTTSVLPKAHVLNQRAMEILEDAGVAAAIDARSTPAHQMSATAWYAGLAGHPDAGRCLAKMECWGAGGEDEQWAAASAWRQRNLPQIRLEPLLREHAQELAGERVRFHHELLDLAQDEDGVTARIRDKDAGTDYEVRAQYLIAADGGRTVPAQIGVGYEGLGQLTETATLYVTADFSALAADDDVLLRWIFAPSLGRMVVMAPMGPDRWGPDSEEWVIHLNYPVGDPRAASDAEVEADVREALGLGDLPMDVHLVTRWTVEAVLAERSQVGRVFLVGDAAHRHPPTGGLGLTSAIHDVHNLCWKVHAVIAGHAGPALLDTYAPERRSSVERNATRSLENAANHFLIGDLMGVSHEHSAQENWANIARMWSDAPEHLEVRSAVRRAMRAQSMEFGEHNVEYGYAYDSAAVVPDGTPAPDSPDDVRIYTPSTRPGSPLPHAWIDDEDGARRPIKDLVAPGRFLLIAGEEGEAWCAAAAGLADAGTPIDAVRIGHVDGDLFDPRLAWTRHRGIGPEGAVLVRPDRFIAWRCPGPSEHPAADLAGALSAVLARPVAVPTHA